MRIVAISLLPRSAARTGCMTLHADLPEEGVRQRIAYEDGIELAAICSHEGKSFSEGAAPAWPRSCDPQGCWVKDATASAEPSSIAGPARGRAAQRIVGGHAGHSELREKMSSAHLFGCFLGAIGLKCSRPAPRSVAASRPPTGW